MNRGIRGLVTEVNYVSSDLVKVGFRLSVGLKYHPGQGVLINNQLHLLSGSPEESLKTNQYEILVNPELLNLGSGTSLGFHPAQIIQVEGPVGSFWPLSARPHQDVVWVCNVQGLAPFLAAVRSAAFRRIRPPKIVLIVEVAEEEELPFRDIFEAHNVVVIPCVTHPTRWVDGFWGRVEDLFRSSRFRLDFERAKFFLSIPEETKGKLLSILLSEKRVAVSNVEEPEIQKGNKTLLDRVKEKQIPVSMPLLRSA